MTNNTIPNVPRELKPVLAMILNALDRDAEDGKQARAEMAAELRSLLSAPSPAGVDGLEVALSSEQILEVFERNGFRIELGASFSARGQIAQLLNAVGEIERLSDAQAIIDGLRAVIDKAWNRSHQLDQKAYIPGALDAWKRPVLQHLPYDFSGNPGASDAQYCNGWNDAGGYWKAHADDLMVERDQQAQRIGELEGLLTAERNKVPLYEAVERACGDLPEDWKVELHMENGAAWIELYDAEGIEVENFPTNNERVDCTINDATDAALSAGAGMVK